MQLLNNAGRQYSHSVQEKLVKQEALRLQVTKKILPADICQVWIAGKLYTVVMPTKLPLSKEKPLH